MILLRAPAKINWFLSIIDKREDGYHDIISLMQCVDLFDTISFEDAEDIELLSDLDIPVSENIVYKAACLVKGVCSYSRGARIVLRKNIPDGAGLGGGSSDAACTLIGLNRLWGLNLNKKELMQLASEIGSDVSFFIGGPFSLVEGRGEKVSSLKTESSVFMLLVKPEISISTSWAYNSYKRGLTKKHVDIKLFCHALDRKNYDLLRHVVFNDLEKTVISRYPAIGKIKEMLIKNGAVIASMSGSGSAVFGIFNSDGEAVSASKKMGKNWCRVVSTLSKKEELIS